MFWVFAFLFFNLFYGGDNISKEVSRTFSVIFLFISFVCVDIHHRFVTRPYLGAKHYFRFVLFSIYIFILAFWLNSVLSFVLHLLFWDFENGNSIEQSSRISYQIGGVNMAVFGGVALRFMIETLNLHKLKEEKEKQAIEANLKLKEVELNLLKSQINPHFFFFCNLLLNRCTATCNLFVLYKETNYTTEKAFFISKSFNMTRKPAFALHSAHFDKHTKKPSDVIYCLYK